AVGAPALERRAGREKASADSPGPTVPAPDPWTAAPLAAGTPRVERAARRGGGARGEAGTDGSVPVGAGSGGPAEGGEHARRRAVAASGGGRSTVRCEHRRAHPVAAAGRSLDRLRRRRRGLRHR